MNGLLLAPISGEIFRFRSFDPVLAHFLCSIVSLVGLGRSPVVRMCVCVTLFRSGFFLGWHWQLARHGEATPERGILVPWAAGSAHLFC